MFALVSPTEHVNSPARVIADGKVQHKYLNPHLIAIATESRDPTEVAKCKKSLSACMMSLSAHMMSLSAHMMSSSACMMSLSAHMMSLSARMMSLSACMMSSSACMMSLSAFNSFAGKANYDGIHVVQNKCCMLRENVVSKQLTPYDQETTDQYVADYKVLPVKELMYKLASSLGVFNTS